MSAYCARPRGRGFPFSVPFIKHHVAMTNTEFTQCPTTFNVIGNIRTISKWCWNNRSSAIGHTVYRLHQLWRNGTRGGKQLVSRRRAEWFVSSCTCKNTAWTAQLTGLLDLLGRRPLLNYGPCRGTRTSETVNSTCLEHPVPHAPPPPQVKNCPCPSAPREVTANLQTAVLSCWWQVIMLCRHR